MSRKFQVVQGYIRLALTENDVVVRESGFVPSKDGLLWGVYDSQKNEIVEAFWTPKEAEERAKQLDPEVD